MNLKKVKKAVENIERYTDFSLRFTTASNCIFEKLEGDERWFVYITSFGTFEPVIHNISMKEEVTFKMSLTDLVYFVDFIEVFMEDAGEGGAGWKAFCQRLSS